MPEEAFTAEGDSQSIYEDHSGASGKPFYRTYCARCGSHVFSKGPAYGAMVFIKAGTLDESGWLQPDTHIWCDEKLPYVQIPAEAKQFPRGPA